MGFFQDMGLGDFIDDFNAVKSEFIDMGQEVVASLANEKSEIESTLSDTAATITETTTEMSSEVKQTVSIPVQIDKDNAQ